MCLFGAIDGIASSSDDIVKLCFVIHDSQVHESTDAQRSELSQNSDLKSSVLKQVLDKGSSSGVKLENPGYTDWKPKQNILNSGKAKMDKEVNANVQAISPDLPHVLRAVRSCTSSSWERSNMSGARSLDSLPVP